MESQPQNPEFRISPENFHPCQPTVACVFGYQPCAALNVTKLLHPTSDEHHIYIMDVQPLEMYEIWNLCNSAQVSYFVHIL